MKHIVLTGGSGFVGTHLQQHLRKLGYTVTCISKSSSDPNTYRCDLLDEQQVLKMFLSFKPDVLIHLAALSSVTSGQTIDYYRSNVVATENILKSIEKSKKNTRLIFFSTAGVYGNQKSGVLSEDLTPLPVSHYGYSKYVCERMIASSFSDLDFTILRPFNIVGIGQNPLFIVPKLINHFCNKSATIEVGNVKTIRDFIDISDCCSITSAIIDNPKSYREIINISSGLGISIESICLTLSELTSHFPQYKIADALIRKNEVLSLVGSAKKLKEILDEELPFVGLADSLNKMLGVYYERK